MKKYNTPKVVIDISAKEDIMLLSDTFVDVGGLWGDNESGENAQN